MKKFFFSMMAVAACILASCSSNDDVKVNSPYGPTGEGYVAFNIMLPTTHYSTRANDDWDDGHAEEYQVKDAILVIFAGTDEASAKFQSAYELDTTPFETDETTTDGCTTEARLTALLQQKEEQSTDEVYAYVIINGKTENLFYVNAANQTLTVKKATVAGDNVTETATEPLTPGSVTFEQFTQYELAAQRIGELGNMLMTSAPNSDKQGGSENPKGAKVTALAKLDKSKIYNTREMARSNPAAEVYVGRSAVKVEVTTNFPSTTTIEGNTDVTFDATSFVWTLGNTNKTFFIGRQFNSTWLELYAPGEGIPATQEAAPGANYKYRFVGYTPIHSGVWRTYWGMDPNYGVDNTTGKLLDNGVPSTTAYTKKTGDIMYTTENTMDETLMTHRNTTYVAVGVKLNGGNKFYTLPGTTGTDFIYDEAGVKTHIKNIVLGLPAWETFRTAVHTEIGVWIGRDDIDVTLTETELEDVEVAIDYNGTATVDFTDVQDKYEETMTNSPIYVYPQGMAYYYVPIQHFSNDETPWDAVNKQSAAYNDTYPVTNRAAYYLGRWGVLRNNWYKLTVTGIRHIGKPEPVEPGPEPDDEVDKYISVKIHVMPWTLRVQDNYKL